MKSPKFTAIFTTDIVQGTPIKVTSDHVTIEIFKEARSYAITPRQYSTVSHGEAIPVQQPIQLRLNDRHWHIMLTVSTNEENSFIARALCENEIDEAITKLAIICRPEIFGTQVYRGWTMGDGGEIFMEGVVRLSSSVTLEEEPIHQQLKVIEDNLTQNADIAERFRLISRFYTKSLSMERCEAEEKLIYLWTALEIYPMKDTTNIKPISLKLASITGIKPEVVKEKLGIGQLYKIRCDLVHDGKLAVGKEAGDFLMRLDNIVYEMLRSISGLPYSGSLHRFLS